MAIKPLKGTTTTWTTERLVVVVFGQQYLLLNPIDQEQGRLASLQSRRAESGARLSNTPSATRRASGLSSDLSAKSDLGSDCQILPRLCRCKMVETVLSTVATASRSVSKSEFESLVVFVDERLRNFSDCFSDDARGGLGGIARIVSFSHCQYP